MESQTDSGRPYMEYSVPAIPPALVMDVCKFASSAVDPNFTRKNLIECFQGKYNETYINRAIQAASQLRLIEEEHKDQFIVRLDSERT